MRLRAIDKEGNNILNPPKNGGTALLIYKNTIISVRIGMFQDCYYLIFNTDICIALGSEAQQGGKDNQKLTVRKISSTE